ncbi:MAG: PepSY-like domain-containing protein [Bacteroidia bacterium]|nr:PepSY-like domain-containing protein [Bacteroidia bacterium]
MKYTKQWIFALAIAGLPILSGCEKETVLSDSKVPEEIATYTSTHFTTHKILQVVKDIDGFTKTYDVVLDGGVNLEFNRKKEIIEIDGNAKLPDSVIPEKIRTYVAANYPSNVITDWQLEGKNQQVGLDSDLDLEFSMNGDFLRIDN